MATITAYESLLLEYKPRPIRSDAAYRRALRLVERLMKQRRTKAEDDVLELLSSLVSQYESRRYPAPDVSPAEMLAHLIDVRGVGPSAVCRETGIGRTTLDGILSGQKVASKAQAVELGTYFHVSPTAFLADAE